MSESVGQDFMRAFPGVRYFRVAKIQKRFEMTKLFELKNVNCEKIVIHLFDYCTRVSRVYKEGSLLREPRDVLTFLLVVKLFSLAILLYLIQGGMLTRKDVVDGALTCNVLYLTT